MQWHPHDRSDFEVTSRVVGDEVVERAPDRRQIGMNPADPRCFGYASASAALRNSAASSVRSHVKVGSRRPKCPYAAVFW